MAVSSGRNPYHHGWYARALNELAKFQINNIMKYEIWMEGYVVQGNEGIAIKLGEYEANSFHEAISKYNIDHPKEEIEKKVYKYIDLEDCYFYWGCKIFDNEIDARKSHG